MSALKASEPVLPTMGLATRSVAVTVISSFLFGYSVCVLNSCGALIAVTFQWCGNEWQSECLASDVGQGLVNASIYLGASVGAALIGRPYVSAWGSRRQMCLSDALFAIGALLCCCAGGVYSLIAGRFVSGVGLGISAIAAPVYIAEISPRALRGSYCAMVGVFITVGILCSITIGLPQGPPPQGPSDRIQDLDTWFWRILLGLPALPALLQALLFWFVIPVDPPSLLVMQERIDDARCLLCQLHGVEMAEGCVGLADTSAAHIELQLQELIEAAASARQIKRIRLFDALCDPYLRFAILLGFGMAALQQLSGINALMSYSNNLFAQAGVNPEDLTSASVAMATANVLVSVCSSRVVDQWGRRKLLLLGTSVQALAMFVLVFSGSASPVLAVGCFSLFVTSFSAGLGAVTWLYLSEIYPTEVRSVALSACGIVNWLSSFVVVFGARLLTLQESCMLFGMVCFTGAIFIYLYVIETKGCSLDDNPITPKSGRASSSLLSSPSNPLLKDDCDRAASRQLCKDGATKTAPYSPPHLIDLRFEASP